MLLLLGWLTLVQRIYGVDMYQNGLQTILLTLSAVSALIAILLFLMIRIDPNDIEPDHKLLKSFTKLKNKALFVGIAATVALISISFTIFLPIAPPEPSPEPTVTLVPATPVVTPTGSIDLYDITPIIYNSKAYFVNSWSALEPLKVDNTVIPSGIGVCVPVADQQRYNLDYVDKKVEHKEILEYMLNQDYNTLDFSYGIDDRSFYGFEQDAPSCLCRIVAQSKSSDQMLGDSDNIVYDSCDFYYNLSEEHVTLDVSNIDTLRLTFYWSYKPDPTKQNCLNLVVINPLLYLKES